MTTATGSVVEAPSEDGVYLVGQYIDARDGKQWTGNDGQTRQPFEVTLLIGRSAFRIEYRTPQDGLAALANTAKGERVAVRVFTRVNKGGLFFSGISARQEVAA